jgi:glycosyltransferase involved in cell wall biosynthesis
MRIAVFYYKISSDNPIGSCHLRMLRGLADQHDFTVFAVDFDNPRPDRIKWVRVPVPIRPLALLFATYRVAAPFVYWFHKLRTGAKFDLVQMVESGLGFGAVSYSHFCHTAYLKHHWKQSGARGLRGRLRWLDHALHASFERAVYSRARWILVPSRGLAGELEQEFPFAAPKIRVLPNAVDVERLARPASFDREAFRRELGFQKEDTVFLFAALGHFERKGLPILIDALARLRGTRIKLLVVGGERGLIDAYRARIEQTPAEGRVVFAGMQSDTSRYFWAADAFAFPSHYETFSLVAYEAAAARLPLIAPRLNGVEEILDDSRTGFLITQTSESVAAALERFAGLPETQRAEMGARARAAVEMYDEARFVQRWQEFYREYEKESTAAQRSGHPLPAGPARKVSS